jgi:hypothetical protein
MPKTWAKLERIEQRIAAARDKQRKLSLAQQDAHEDERRLRDALVEFDLPLDGSPPSDAEAKKLWNEWTAARERARGPWSERAAKLRRETTRLEGEREQFIRENLGALVAELTPEAEERVSTLIECLQAALASLTEYEQTTTKAVRLAVAGGAGGADVPRLQGSEQLRQAIRQMLAREVALPLPGAFTEPEGASGNGVVDRSGTARDRGGRVMDEQLTPEERQEHEREEAGRELLAAIKADRERQAAMRQWLREAIEAGYEQRAEDERRQREEDR